MQDCFPDVQSISRNSSLVGHSGSGWHVGEKNDMPVVVGPSTDIEDSDVSDDPNFTFVEYGSNTIGIENRVDSRASPYLTPEGQDNDGDVANTHAVPPIPIPAPQPPVALSSKAKGKRRCLENFSCWFQRYINGR